MQWGEGWPINLVHDGWYQAVVSATTFIILPVLPVTLRGAFHSCPSVSRGTEWLWPCSLTIWWIKIYFSGILCLEILVYPPYELPLPGFPVFFLPASMNSILKMMSFMYTFSCLSFTFCLCLEWLSPWSSVWFSYQSVFRGFWALIYIKNCYKTVLLIDPSWFHIHLFDPLGFLLIFETWASQYI